MNNDSFGGVLVRWIVRLLLVAVGVVFFVGLLALVLALAVVWGLRALWCKLTGQPVAPWVMRVDPRSGWSTVVGRGARWTPPQDAAPQRRGGVLPANVQVSDVDAREVH